MELICGVCRTYIKRIWVLYVAYMGRIGGLYGTYRWLIRVLYVADMGRKGKEA